MWLGLYRLVKGMILVCAGLWMVRVDSSVRSFAPFASISFSCSISFVRFFPFAFGLDPLTSFWFCFARSFAVSICGFEPLTSLSLVWLLISVSFSCLGVEPLTSPSVVLLFLASSLACWIVLFIILVACLGLEPQTSTSFGLDPLTSSWLSFASSFFSFSSNSCGLDPLTSSWFWFSFANSFFAISFSIFGLEPLTSISFVWLLISVSFSCLGVEPLTSPSVVLWFLASSLAWWLVWLIIMVSSMVLSVCRRWICKLVVLVLL